MIHRREIDSPFGPLTLEERDGTLAALHFEANGGADDTPLLRDAIRQLAEYFAQRRRSFDLPLAPAATPFQERLRAAMCAIPYGETPSTCTHFLAVCFWKGLRKVVEDDSLAFGIG